MKGWITFGLVSASLVGLVWGCTIIQQNKNEKKAQQEIIDKINEPYFFVDHFGLVHLNKECWAINEIPTTIHIEEGNNATINLNLCEQPFNIHAIRFIPKNNWDSAYKYFHQNEEFCNECCTPQYIEGIKSTFIFPKREHDELFKILEPHMDSITKEIRREQTLEILMQLIDSNYTRGELD